MSKVFRRFFSVILVSVMLLSAMPAFAADDEEEHFLLSIYARNFKSVYIDGEFLDLSGIEVIGVYSDWSEKDITNFTVSLPHGTPMILSDPEEGEAIVLFIVEYERDGFGFDFYTWISVLPHIIINGVAIPTKLIENVVVLTPTQDNMTEILHTENNEIIFDLSQYSSVDMIVDAGIFRKSDKTLTFITGNGRSSVRGQNLWNNSGKQRLISIRNNRLNIKNI